jgi:hypothetical protein
LAVSSPAFFVEGDYAMNRDEHAHTDVDRLLEDAFPDDLPAEADAKMASQLDRFCQRLMEAEKYKASVSIRPHRWSKVLAGASLAAVSVLFIIIGLGLRASRPQADFGSSLASLQWAAFFSEKITNFQSMECAVHLSRLGKASEQFIIQWITPEETRIRIIAAGEESVRTVHPSKPESSVLEHIAEPGPIESAAPVRLEADLRPVEGLLSSSELRKLLDGRWQPAGTERKGECDWESFSVSSARAVSPSRVTVDTCTFLPVRLEKEVGSGERIEALFRWVLRSEPRGPILRQHVSRSATETAPS